MEWDRGRGLGDIPGFWSLASPQQVCSDAKPSRPPGFRWILPARALSACGLRCFSVSITAEVL